MNTAWGRLPPFAFRTWPALYYLEDGIIIGKVEGEVPVPKTLEEVHLPEWR